ncbi:MAG: R2-like ligand-binding oxidase [Chloroflexi bacterium]|nr:R2-like ligand-binding oxidase [Chloroflexota bacterium]
MLSHHTSFATTTRGLRRESPPMRLFEKAKKFGIWNPSDIDFTQDKADWQKLTTDEKEVILHLTALFQAGEEAVTLDLLPLIMTIAKEGRIEEEMFLTTFLWEEAKHTDFFRRFLDDVVQTPGDLSRFHTDTYKMLFYDALPSALSRLTVDSSPAAQIQASVTYNMIVEGVLAETGYHAYFTMLKNNNLMPGQCEGIRLLKQDESRHIAYGVFLISRLVAENHALWDTAENTMNTLLLPTIGIINEVFALYDPVPFGLKVEDFINYATMQFSKRLERIQKARTMSPDQLERATQDVIDRDDA